MYDDPKATGIIDTAFFKMGFSRRIAGITPGVATRYAHRLTTSETFVT